MRSYHGDLPHYGDVSSSLLKEVESGNLRESEEENDGEDFGKHLVDLTAWSGWEWMNKQTSELIG